VDDEPDVRESLCEVVEMAGCTTLTAANGAEALEILAQHRPCLVLIDLMMPVMAGDELIDAIQRRPDLAELPFVVCTSAPAKAPAGVPVLPKPVNITALWNWMRQNCSCVNPPVSE
jgi:CheY-like chemotaxis protein